MDRRLPRQFVPNASSISSGSPTSRLWSATSKPRSATSKPRSATSKPRSSTSRNGSTGTRLTPRSRLQPIPWMPPGLFSRAPVGASQAGNRDILDIIAIAFRLIGSRTSSLMYPRPAPAASLRCRPNRGRMSPSQRGIRSLRSPNWPPRSPSTKDTPVPAPAAAKSIVARSLSRSALTSSGHAWLR